MTGRAMELTLGPLLFHWSPERIGDFYARIADEAPVERVYLGEVVCGKRAPLVDHALAGAAERLASAGKTVVWSGLGLPATPRDRRGIAALAGLSADMQKKQNQRPPGKFEQQGSPLRFQECLPGVRR